jgi:energy-coupling factor transporter ATP-binding protein EcfA2
MDNDIWYIRLGFKENPFSIKPKSSEYGIYGNDETLININKKIEESKLIFVNGNFGSGKTTLMKSIISKFGGKKRVIYYNCNQNTMSVNFDKLLYNAGNFFNKLLHIKKKNIILILDEAQDLNSKDFKNIFKYYKSHFFKSVVFVTTKDYLNFPKELIELIGENKFSLGILSSKDAVKMIRQRIGEISTISDSNIVRIFSKNNNPRAFLKNCEDVFRHVTDNDESKITMNDIDKILG